MAGNFILLPFRESIRAGEFGDSWADSDIAVLPVLIAHENRKTRIANPSLGRIAVLAGVAKRTASAATNHLYNARWLDKTRVVIPEGRTRFEYRMIYAPYDRRPDPKAWVRMNSAVIFNGIWAVMQPSVRKLYLVLLGFSWSEKMAWVIDESGGQEWLDAESYAEDGGPRFVDNRYLPPSFLNNAAGLGLRTGRRAWAWLVDSGLIFANEEGATCSPTDNYREGIIMADPTNFRCDAVLSRLESEPTKIMPGARCRLTNTRKRQKKANWDTASLNSGHNQPLGRTLTAVQPDTREPEQAF